MKRNWRILCYNILMNYANELDIDVAELLSQFNLSSREIRYFYNWCDSTFLW